MEDREDEIIIEQNEMNATKREEDDAPFLNKLFTKYLTIGLSLIAMIVYFFARFILTCGANIATYEWFFLIAFACICMAVIIELVKIVKNGKVDLKSTLLPVLAVALIFF